MADWFPTYKGSRLSDLIGGIGGLLSDNPERDAYDKQFGSMSWMDEATQKSILGDRYVSEVPEEDALPPAIPDYPEGKDPSDAFGFLVGDMPEANVDPDIIQENMGKGKGSDISALADALTKIGGEGEVREPDAYGPKLSGINPYVGPSRGRGARAVDTGMGFNVLTVPDLLKATVDRNIAAREGFPQFASLLGSGWTDPMNLSAGYRQPRPVFTSSSWNASNLFS